VSRFQAVLRCGCRARRCWKAGALSLLARNSAVSTIRNYVRVLTDFQTVCNDYPWRWSPADVGDYVTVLHARAHERRATPARSRPCVGI
jgi:hypothetical protein